MRTSCFSLTTFGSVARTVVKFTNNLRSAATISTCAVLLFLMVSSARAITVTRNPVQGAGFVNVDLGPLPLVLGAPVGTSLNYDVVLSNMQHIELMSGATTTAEFAIGNTGNTANLNYHIAFDLSDMQGNLITTNALVLNSTAPAGFIHLVNLDLSPLPPVKFHDFHVRIDTSFAGPNTGSGRFDFSMAGGAGDFGTGVSGPVRFNRAVVGQWVPESSGTALAWIAIACSLQQLRLRRWRLALRSE
jgi:hypothetical protein